MATDRDARSPDSFVNLACDVVIPSPRWIRVKFGGVTVADSKRALLLRQYGPGRLPTYYFPPDDVRMDLLRPVTPTTWTLVVGDRVAEGAAWTEVDPSPDLAALAGYITFDWDQMDAWFEEEEEIFVHARDPYHRVDVLLSSRHLRIEIAGVTVADSRRPALLFETHLPTRYYLPAEDVRTDLLEPSDTTSRCPFKGIATYWSARIGARLVPDVVWSYPDPIPECPKIKGLLCFFNERVDLYLDGELQSRPLSPWSEDAPAN